MFIKVIAFILGTAIGNSLNFSNTNKYYMFNTLVIGLAGVAICIDILMEVL